MYAIFNDEPVKRDLDAWPSMIKNIRLMQTVKHQVVDESKVSSQSIHGM